MRFKFFDIVDGIVELRARLCAQFHKPRSRSGVLLVSSGGLGDTILFSLAAPRFMELAGDGEPVHVLVRTDTAAAAFLFPPGVGVIQVDYRRFLRNPLYRLRTCMDLGNSGYRLAISTDHLRLPTVDDALVMACSAEQTIALEPRSWPKHDLRLQRNRRWYSRWVKASDGMAHRMVRWVELANALTDRNDPPPLVRFDAERLPQPVRRERPLMILHPFSAIAERQHRPRLYQRIIEMLPPDFDVILSAAPSDLARNGEFGALLDAPNVSLNEEGLEVKAALMGAARLVVSVDTSVMHLAVGIGVPTLCLASAAHVADSIPYDFRMTPDNVTFLFHDMECRGCLGNCIHPLEDGVYACIAGLDPRQVTDKVGDLLKKSGGP